MLAQPAPALLVTLLQLLYQLAEAPDVTSLHADLGLSARQARDQQRLCQVYEHKEDMGIVNQDTQTGGKTGGKAIKNPHCAMQ